MITQNYKSFVNCSEGHALALFDELESFNPNYVENIYKCNICEDGFDSKIHPSAHCMLCLYDLCPPCHLDQQRNVVFGFQCSQNHRMTLIDDPTRSETEYHKEGYGCDACGNGFNVETHPSIHCAPCEFDLCPSCFKMQKDQFDQPEAQVPAQAQFSYLCPQGHTLIETNDLKSIEPEYKHNIYGCDTCNGFFNSETHSSFHCGTCNFNLCPSCIEAEKNAYLQNEAQAQAQAQNENNIAEDLAALSIEDNSKQSSAPVLKRGDTKRDGELISEEKRCVVCLEAEKTHVFIPCGHLCACAKCSTELMKTEGTCPMCRRQIQSKVRVYS